MLPPRCRPAPDPFPRLAEAAGLAALALALIGTVQLLLTGPQSLTLAPGIRLGLDAVGATISVLVAFVGWIVLRYCRSYLVGEARAARAQGGILVALAAVLVLALAGDLILIALCLGVIGIAMRDLLLFYPDRPAARRAAAKFTWVWCAGDAVLVVAVVLTWVAFGTTDLASINAAATAGPLPLAAKGAVAALVLVALLKTAAFPVQGWLTEVMEAPTPVSALLHAGIINAGGLLLIRTADLVQAVPGAMAALVLLGGLSALLGAMVMLTQSAVKTALAWSTVAQMGFLLLQCGLGLWTLALLHVVAHSLYKAHAFLASGQAVRAVAAARRPGPVAVPGAGAVARAFGMALVLYAVVALVFWAIGGTKSAQALALGRDPDLRHGLSGGPGPGRCRTPRADAAHGGGLACDGHGIFRLSPAGGQAVGVVAAAAAGPRRAGMGADRAGAGLVRADRGRTGPVPAVDAPSGDGRPARPPGQRAVHQRPLRPDDRRIPHRPAQLIPDIVPCGGFHVP